MKEKIISDEVTQWWESRRWRYNLGLILAGILAFLLYAVLGIILIMPNDQEFDITLFTIVFQGFGYLLMMGIANSLYNLGEYYDRKNNNLNDIKYRERLFKKGFWFSVCLPFLIPLMIVVQYFIEFYKK